MKGSEKKPPRFFPSPSALVEHPDPDGVVAIDGDLYLAQSGTIRRYVAGAQDSWTPADPGDAVLVPQPSYPLFEHLTQGGGIVGRIAALEIARRLHFVLEVVAQDQRVARIARHVARARHDDAHRPVARKGVVQRGTDAAAHHLRGRQFLRRRITTL